MSSPSSPTPPDDTPPPPQTGVRIPPGVVRTAGLPARPSPETEARWKREREEHEEKKKLANTPPPGEDGAGSGLEGRVAVIFILVFICGYLFLIYALKSSKEDRPVQSWLKELDRRVTNKARPAPAPVVRE